MVREYLYKIEPYLYLINDHWIARRVWKIQINMHLNFLSSRDTEETCTYYIGSNNVSIMQGKNTNIIIEIFYTTEGIKNNN